MDQEFERRWRAGEAPFNAFTLAPEGPLPPGRWRPALTAVLAVLEDAEPRGPLYQLLDRNGDAVPVAWTQVHELLHSEPALADAGAVELFPADRRFFLRFRTGTFDLTGPKHLLEQAADAASAAGVPQLSVEIAKLFFTDPAEAAPEGGVP